ncbi:hypothetical protein LXA43DRAFT_1026943 [Ganoderma leucocontextum]|nr:hypothetical protein LXA43DRAFT_1026943 [Ganoderma leucocontextum]
MRGLCGRSRARTHDRVRYFNFAPPSSLGMAPFGHALRLSPCHLRMFSTAVWETQRSGRHTGSRFRAGCLAEFDHKVRPLVRLSVRTITASGSGEDNLLTARGGTWVHDGSFFDCPGVFGPHGDGIAAALAALDNHTNCQSRHNGPLCDSADFASVTTAEKPATMAGKRAREAPYTHCTRDDRAETGGTIRIELHRVALKTRAGFPRCKVSLDA